MMQRKFRKGDKVVVRPESDSPFKGQIGIVEKAILSGDEAGYFYWVKFASVPMRFNEDLLDLVL